MPSRKRSYPGRQGALRHCTDMEVDRQCAHARRQADAEAEEHRVRAAVPAAGEDAGWPNLAPVLSSKTIDWDLISRQYGQIVKYTTALRLGTAEAEQVLQGRGSQTRYSLSCTARSSGVMISMPSVRALSSLLPAASPATSR